MRLNNISDHPKFVDSIQQLNTINYELRQLGGYSAHNHHHILFVIKELLGDNCKNYLEIGTALGSSMISVMKSKYKTNFYGIDLFQKETGSSPKNEVMTIINSLNTNKHTFQLIQGSSTDEASINQISKIKEGIDLFYIDGNHGSDYVYNDFMNYEKYINKNGVVIFDDSIFRPYADGIDEIKESNIMKNYIDLGRIPTDAYSSKSEAVSLTNIDKNGNSIYKYNSEEDDVSICHDNWQQIFLKI